MSESASVVTKNECPILAPRELSTLKGKIPFHDDDRRRSRGQLAVSELGGDPLHLLLGERGSGVDMGVGLDVAWMILWHISLVLRDDFLQRRRVPLGLELRGMAMMEPVVRKWKISALELVREPLDLFVCEAGGMCRIDVRIWNGVDIPLKRRVAETRRVDVSLVRSGLALLALFVDGICTRL